MSRVSEMRRKEVINLRDGSRLGYVIDVEINEHSGTVDSIIVPGPYRFLGLFGRTEDYIISWDEIDKIGEDIILVDVVFPEMSHQRSSHRGRRQRWYSNT